MDNIDPAVIEFSTRSHRPSVAVTVDDLRSRGSVFESSYRIQEGYNDYFNP